MTDVVNRRGSGARRDGSNVKRYIPWEGDRIWGVIV